MQTATTDVWEIYKAHGTHAAYDALYRCLGRPMRGWGKKQVQDLERWAIAFGDHRVWPLAVLAWIALLLILKAEGEQEKRAYFFNDLGTAFFLSLDPRCFVCYHRALRLTKSPGRRMRTLRRVGRSMAVLTGNCAKSRRWLNAALLVGQRYRLDPSQVEAIKDDLKHLESRSAAVRRDMEAHQDECLIHMLKGVEPEKL